MLCSLAKHWQLSRRCDRSLACIWLLNLFNYIWCPLGLICKMKSLNHQPIPQQVVNHFRHLCAQCVMLLVAPGPSAQGCSWPRSGPSDSRHLGPDTAHTFATDLNQVMKNRSGPAIIQSSSLIRFLGPVLCEPELKPSPCVSRVRTRGHFLPS